MTEYLSAEWIEALDGALRACPVSTPNRLVIEQVVLDVPARGEVRYTLVIDAEGARVTGDSGSPAQLRLTTEYATAVAIARGDETAQIALANGRLRLGGDVDVLVRAADALARLDDATAPVRRETTYAQL